MLSGSAKTARFVFAAWAVCSALFCPGCQTELSEPAPAAPGAQAVGMPLPAAASLQIPGYTDLDDGGVDEPGTGVRCAADAAQTQKTDYSQPGPHAVAKLDLTFEDASRPIVATDKHAAAPARVLVTTIYYPTGRQRGLFGDAAVATGGPLSQVGLCDPSAVRQT